MHLIKLLMYIEVPICLVNYRCRKSKTCKTHLFNDTVLTRGIKRDYHGPAILDIFRQGNVVVHCPAANTLHRQYAILSQHMHWSFLLNRTSHKYVRMRRLRAYCAIARKNILTRCYCCSDVLTRWAFALFSCQHEFSHSQDFSPFG